MKDGLKTILVLASAVALLTSCAGFSGRYAVGERQGVMKSYSGNMKAIGAFLKTGQGSAADVASRARKMASGTGNLKGMFPMGTSSTDLPGKTRAKPEIWQKKAAFDKAADDMADYATKFANAAASGDKAAMGAAAGALGKQGCGGCHKNFRGPKPKA